MPDFKYEPEPIEVNFPPAPGWESRMVDIAIRAEADGVVIAWSDGRNGLPYYLGPFATLGEASTELDAIKVRAAGITDVVAVDWLLAVRKVGIEVANRVEDARLDLQHRQNRPVTFAEAAASIKVTL